MYYYLFNQFSVTENLGLFLVFCLVTMVMMNISKQLSGYFIQLICWTGADGLNHQLNTFQLKGVDFSLFSLGQKSSSLGECWILYTLPSTGSVLFLHVFLLFCSPLSSCACSPSPSFCSVSSPLLLSPPPGPSSKNMRSS